MNKPSLRDALEDALRPNGPNVLLDLIQKIVEGVNRQSAALVPGGEIGLQVVALHGLDAPFSVSGTATRPGGFTLGVSTPGQADVLQHSMEGDELSVQFDYNISGVRYDMYHEGEPRGTMGRHVTHCSEIVSNGDGSPFMRIESDPSRPLLCSENEIVEMLMGDLRMAVPAERHGLLDQILKDADRSVYGVGACAARTIQALKQALSI